MTCTLPCKSSKSGCLHTRQANIHNVKMQRNPYYFTAFNTVYCICLWCVCAGILGCIVKWDGKRVCKTLNVFLGLRIWLDLHRWYTDVLKSFELWASWDLVTTVLKISHTSVALTQQIFNTPQSVLDAVSQWKGIYAIPNFRYLQAALTRISWVKASIDSQEGLNSVIECLTQVLNTQEEIDRVLLLKDKEAQSFLNSLDFVWNCRNSVIV